MGRICGREARVDEGPLDRRKADWHCHDAKMLQMLMSDDDAVDFFRQMLTHAEEGYAEPTDHDLGLARCLCYVARSRGVAGLLLRLLTP